MAITPRLESTKRVTHEGVGEFLVCTIVFEEDGVAVSDPHEHLIPLHERAWTEAEISAELGRIARRRVEIINLKRSQSIDTSQIAIGTS